MHPRSAYSLGICRELGIAIFTHAKHREIILSFDDPKLAFRHALIFPQGGPDCYPVEIQPAPQPVLPFGTRKAARFVCSLSQWFHIDLQRPQHQAQIRAGRGRDVPAKPRTRQSFQILVWRPSSPQLASTFIRTALCQSNRPELSISPV